MRGRRDAEFAAYVDGRLPAFRRMAYLLCHDWHRADDLVEVSLAKLYTPWSRFREDRAVESPTVDRLYLMQALRALPSCQRAVVVLRCWEDLSVAETAGVLGCSEGSVKTHLSRGLAALRTALAPTGPALEGHPG